ncbi:DUF262 domain-containing protein [Lachnospiraceae bacterium 46-61]
MSLQDEIIERSSKIFRDAYQMSIGELINIYRDGEMDIHPEFQRVFRWSKSQKTRLIESIMLNIPIPSIFVSQNDEGVWDVIDGVQRLSTIFQFVGIFKDETNKSFDPLVLQKTDYLPSFEGMMWQNPNDASKSFTKEQQLAFKRARIDVIIVKKESDPNTKYELFERLNTGGSKLSDQEVRNCLMIMTNRDFYSFLNSLSKNEDFNNCIVITDRKEDEQFKLELILRLLIAVKMDLGQASNYNDLKELLDKEMVKMINVIQDNDYLIIKDKFKRTFKLLNNLLGEDSFRKYSDNKHKGAFLVGAFQGIAPGIYFNIDKVEKMEAGNIKNKIKNFYEKSVYLDSVKSGARAVPRFKDLTLFGKEYFSNEN